MLSSELNKILRLPPQIIDIFALRLLPHLRPIRNFECHLTIKVPHHTIRTYDFGISEHALHSALIYEYCF